jgi:membrane-associated phospholipid phosphatase
MFRFFIFTSFILTSISTLAAESISPKLSFQQKHISPAIHRGTDRTSLLTLLGGAFAVGLANPQDDQVRSDWKNHQHIDKNSAHVGDLLGTGGVAVLSSGFQYFFDDRTYVYESHLRGLAYGGIVIYTLKTVFARPRPGNSDNHQSFPSGHSSIAFMSATHLSYAYGWKAAVIAYPMAAFVGASRLADDVHWFSDTVAGAFLGFIVGRATYYDENDFTQINVTEQVRRESRIQTQILPIWTAEIAGLAAFVSF